MKVAPTALADVLRIDLPTHSDARGTLVELMSGARWATLGLPPLVHDVMSISARHVVRGLHLQEPNAQGKLVTVLAGRVFDVAVDLRPGSASYARWLGLELAAPSEAGRPWPHLWIPPGFAHGFLVLSDTATVFYRCSAPYDPSAQHIIRFDDATLAIDWPLGAPPILSEKDRLAPTLADWQRRRA